MAVNNGIEVRKLKIGDTEFTMIIKGKNNR